MAQQVCAVPGSDPAVSATGVVNTYFSDDLTDFDCDHKGWFLNIVGSY